MSSPADFITQVHNPEEDQQAQEKPGFCARFFCCLCQPKKSPASKNQSINSQPAAANPVIQHNTYHTAQANGRGPTKAPPPPPNQVTTAPKHNIGAPINQQPRPPGNLLGPLAPEDRHKKCLVLDLDETLVHSSFKPIPNADFVISIELESVTHRVYVRKRPGVDNFLKVMGEKFEVVIFTASLSKYADPLLDILDRFRIVKARLFREACVQHYGNYVKDLSHLGRRLEDTIIIDNSPFSYMFQPDNAIPITSWFNDKNDRQLYDLIPFMESLTNCDDVCQILQRKKALFAQQ